MPQYSDSTSVWIQIRLISDTTFGRGDGVAGVVDAEVQHDALGFPYLSGKTLKGLLSAACAEVLDALTRSSAQSDWHEIARSLFGDPGSGEDSQGQLHVGDAQFPSDLRAHIAYDNLNEGQRLSRQDVLELTTAQRRQSAIDPQTGAPLRQHALLAACAKSLRRAGTGRNRGRGRITVQLFADAAMTTPDAALANFTGALQA
jgi:hypothetical protein